jgi:hypothetical protein
MKRSTDCASAGRPVRSSWMKLVRSISRTPPRFGFATPRPVSSSPRLLPLNLAHKLLLAAIGVMPHVVVPTTSVVGEVAPLRS